MDDFDTQIHSDELPYDNEEPWTDAEVQELDTNGEYDGFLQEHSRELDTLCLQCRTHECVEDGFCSSQCEQMYHDNVRDDEGETYNADGDGWGYDDIQSMYDDDPSPYDGTYSEM